MISDKEIAKVQELAKLPMHWKPWLPFDPSAAFICCIGAGPWKYGRRRKIQLQGLERLAGRDLQEAVLGNATTKTIFDESLRVDWFPLKWQNQMTGALAFYLRQLGRSLKKPITLADFCAQAPFNDGWRKLFYDVCGCPKGAKVLSLFCRDYMRIPSFPIDRHVRKILKENGLPDKEEQVLQLCEMANVDPIHLARCLGTSRLNGGNPDWSGWPTCSAPEKITKGQP